MMSAPCARPGCWSLSFDGNPLHYCTKQCHDADPVNQQRCARPGCMNASFDEKPTSFCSKKCHDAALGGGVPCARAGCPRPSWNGNPTEYCSKACRDGKVSPGRGPGPGRDPTPPIGIPCARPGCPCQSWNGNPTEYCCKACKKGTACSRLVHAFKGLPVSHQRSIGVSPCANPSCPCDAYHGQTGKFCCKTCLSGTPCSLRQHVVTHATMVPHAGMGLGSGVKMRALSAAALRALASIFDIPGGHSAAVINKYYIARPSAILDKFKKGLAQSTGGYPPGWSQSHGGTQTTGHYTFCGKPIRFAFHGSASDANYASICQNGFNTGVRSGQACGTGEYFGGTASVSHGYAGSTSGMLLAAIVVGPHLSSHSGSAVLVCDNPAGDPTTTYCLPLFFVTYGGRSTAPF